MERNKTRFGSCASALLMLLALALPVLASAPDTGMAVRSRDDANARLLEAARVYKTSLEELLPLLERELARAEADVLARRQLVELGAVTRLEVEQSEAEVARAKDKIATTTTQLKQVEALIVETEANRELVVLPRGLRYVETPRVIRNDGAGGWRLERASLVAAFFAERFGRPAPISAFGQTGVHDRLGFDHRDAVDIAVHPDSAEGQAVMAFLREAGVPFLAFRTAVRGVATGPHIHVGYPSGRLRR
jgi:hypothetical protein